MCQYRECIGRIGFDVCYFLDLCALNGLSPLVILFKDIVCIFFIPFEILYVYISNWSLKQLNKQKRIRGLGLAPPTSWSHGCSYYTESEFGQMSLHDLFSTFIAISDLSYVIVTLS